MVCPSCQRPILKRLPYYRVSGVFQCPRCQAVFGQCLEGDSYLVVLPSLTTDPVPPRYQARYDLRVISPSGTRRRRGTFDTRTGYIAQVG